MRCKKKYCIKEAFQIDKMNCKHRHTTSLHCTSFYCTLQIMALHILEVCDNCLSSKSRDSILQQPMMDYCLSYFGNSYFDSTIILPISYGGLWSVIFDVVIIIILRHLNPCPYKKTNIIFKNVCYDCFTLPYFILSLQIPLVLKIQWY